MEPLPGRQGQFMSAAAAMRALSAGSIGADERRNPDGTARSRGSRGRDVRARPLLHEPGASSRAGPPQQAVQNALLPVAAAVGPAAPLLALPAPALPLMPAPGLQALPLMPAPGLPAPPAGNPQGSHYGAAGANPPAASNLEALISQQNLLLQEQLKLLSAQASKQELNAHAYEDASTLLRGLEPDVRTIMTEWEKGSAVLHARA